MRRLCMALAVAAMLVGCGDQHESALRELFNEKHRVAGAQEADLDALLALAPAGLEVRVGEVRFDKRLGATIVRDLRLAGADTPDVGVRIDELRLWDLDVDALKAVLSGGADAAEMKPIVRRLLVRNVASEGFTAGDTGLTLKLGAFALDNVTARRVEAPAVPDADEAAKSLQALAAGALSWKIDAIGAADVSGLVRDKERGGDIRFGFRTAHIDGYDRGDIGRQVYVGQSLGFIGPERFSLDANPRVSLGGQASGGENDKVATAGVASAPGFAEAFANAFTPALYNPVTIMTAGYTGTVSTATVDRVTVGASKFFPALEYLSRLELPPMDETDLLSVGEIRIVNQSQWVQGDMLFRIAETVYAPMEFDWLVPSRVKLDFRGAEINLERLIDFGIEQERALSSNEETDGGDPLPPGVRAAIAARDLNPLRGEATLEWTWDAETGDAKLVEYISGRRLLDYGLEFELEGPSLERWRTLVSSDADEDEINASLKLRRFHMSLVDRSIIERALEVAAPYANSTPEQLRNGLPAMLRVGATAAASEFPPARDFVTALGDFVEKGGELMIDISPDEPVSVSELEEMDTDPEALVDRLKLSVTQKD